MRRFVLLRFSVLTLCTQADELTAAEAKLRNDGYGPKPPNRAQKSERAIRPSATQ
jgi:hypothetical protein